ncbi:hypothetical protein ElyMa_006247900 [Elysia marginata]|uniref:Chitin-binding type-2 domain-containing protein n=1 Tax=Elysia marginata TaxID=1093978 RepID=A0AAV4H9E5_9GAST|nr:hypothetical protein ElyMa_006247900 [Elysia marginata]
MLAVAVPASAMILHIFLVWGLSAATAQFNLCPAPDGDFPNPASEGCTTFFRCANNQATMLRCPDMQIFDFLFRSCRSGTQLHCERQLEVFAIPANPTASENPDAQSSVRGAQSVNPLAAFLGNAGGTATSQEGGLVSLGAGLGGIGAGLIPGTTGLLSLLALLGDADVDRRGRRRGRGDNDLATMMVLSGMMNQMNPGLNRRQVQQQPQQPQYQRWNQQPQPQPQAPPYQQGQSWNQQPQAQTLPRPQRPPRNRQLQQGQQPPSPVIPDSGLLPASAVLPSATTDSRQASRGNQQTVTTVEESGGQVSRLPGGKTIVVIPQPTQTK